MAWCVSPEIIPVEMDEPLASVWDDPERAKNAVAVLVPGLNPFHVGNKPRSVDINLFHDRTGHLSEPILRESARQQGITLTGRMEPCNSCLPARGQRAPAAKKRSGGRVERDLAPNDVLAVDMCGPFTPSLGGNLYMFYGVDHATGYIVNYGLRRKACLLYTSPSPRDS